VRACRLALLVALAASSGGCISISLGSGFVVPPADARDAIEPSFTFAPGAVVDLPHDVRPSDPDAPRLIRLVLGVGVALTGVRDAQGALNVNAGPVFLRADVTVLRLSEALLLRGTAQVGGPGLDVQRDPVGALGSYDVPSVSAWAALFGGTLEVVTGKQANLLMTLGLGVHTFAGDRIETTTMLGPELHVSLDLDLFRLFGRDD